MSMADKVAVMNAGTVRQVAPPQELYERPRTEWVARFIGSPPMNLFRGTRRNGSIDLGEAGSVDLAGIADEEVRQREVLRAGGSTDAAETRETDAEGITDDRSAEAEPGTISLGVRPEDLGVVTEPPADGNTVQGVVDTVEPLGEYVLVNVDVNDQIVNAKVGDTDLERDDPVYLTFADDDAYLYGENGELVA